MPSEINPAGYKDLRGYVKDNWNHIALLDDQDNEVIRVDIAGSALGQVTSDGTTNPATVEITVTGQDLADAGASLPVTMSSTEAYKSQTATSPMGEDPFTNAKFETVLDELVLTHDYSLPQ